MKSSTALPPVLWAAVLFSVALGGCERGKQAEGPLGAKVNGAAITVDEINRASAPAGKAEAPADKTVAQRTLNQLINQQLLVQQAETQKLAQDPAVAHALEMARRQVLAKAWLQKVLEAAPKPTDAEIAKFYDDNPGLFAQRRLYRLLQLAVPGDVAMRDRLQEQLKMLDASPDKSQLMQRLAGWMNSQGIKFRANTVVQAAEQLPIDLVSRFAQMKPGQWLLMPGEGGFQVLQVAATQDQPVDRDKARPVIEQYLSKRAGIDVSRNEVKRLRAAAKIEYFGDFKAAGADAEHAGLPEMPAETPSPGTGAAEPAAGGAPSPAGGTQPPSGGAQAPTGEGAKQ